MYRSQMGFCVSKVFFFFCEANLNIPSENCLQTNFIYKSKNIFTSKAPSKNKDMQQNEPVYSSVKWPVTPRSKPADGVGVSHCFHNVSLCGEVFETQCIKYHNLYHSLAVMKVVSLTHSLYTHLLFLPFHQYQKRNCSK